MKALAILRVSTTTQQIDNQRDELLAFIRSQGYDEIIPIEAVGASAIKMDDKYLELVNKVKETIIADPEIKAAGVWELSRLGRNEIILMEFKEFFIKNHIQFICKNPYMKLLNDDGTVNGGMELAFSLFATMSKQEMIEKKERFRRTKKANAAKGKYIGGSTVKFGYCVDGRGFFQEKPEDSAIVKLIFDLYSTGDYSTYTLTKELNERGISVTDSKVNRILSFEGYTGVPVSGAFDVYYPPIISKELFDRCAIIRQNNKIDMKRGKRICLGAKLIKCPVCGATCTSNTKHYKCCKSSNHGCKNTFALRQDVADELLYRYAYGLHMMWLMNISEGKMEEYRKELEIVDEKLETTQKKIDAFGQKKQRIIDTYLEGLLDKKTRDLRLSKLEDDVKYQRDYCNSLQDKRRAIMRLLSSNDTNTVENFMRAAAAMTEEDKYTIIHKHIESLVAVQESYGKRDKRTHRDNAVHITIKAIEGSTVEYLYFPKYYEGRNLYILIDGKWVPDTLEGAVYAMPED